VVAQGRAQGRMRAPRVVLDTNVLVSALLFHAGEPSWLRIAWQAETIRPLASHDTTAELIRVLSYPKFKLTVDEHEDLLGDYLPWCETVTVPDRITVPDCRDPSDRPFLELAVAARADALITGDGDLLALAKVFVVPILPPAAFRDRMQGKAG
jgi:putative PIN family toxin of toxin-antitoxin system